MTVHFDSQQSVLHAVGNELGSSDYITMDQQRIRRFADLTDDHHWIHVDSDRAADGPFGAVIAHGYLTLSCATRFLSEIFTADVRMGLNYGCNKVRFPAPVRAGRRIRGCGKLMEAHEIDANGVQAVILLTIEIEEEDKPACVAETLSRLYF